MKRLTKKRFSRKWPCDEWLQPIRIGRNPRRSFGSGSKRYILVTTGNLKKWISVKYYGYEEEET